MIYTPEQLEAILAAMAEVNKREIEVLQAKGFLYQAKLRLEASKIQNKVLCEGCNTLRPVNPSGAMRSHDCKKARIATK